jgi:hypothetical protein
MTRLANIEFTVVLALSLVNTTTLEGGHWRHPAADENRLLFSPYHCLMKRLQTQYFFSLCENITALSYCYLVNTTRPQPPFGGINAFSYLYMHTKRTHRPNVGLFELSAFSSSFRELPG